MVNISIKELTWNPIHNTGAYSAFIRGKLEMPYYNDIASVFEPGEEIGEGLDIDMSLHRSVVPYWLSKFIFRDDWLLGMFGYDVPIGIPVDTDPRRFREFTESWQYPDQEKYRFGRDISRYQVFDLGCGFSALTIMMAEQKPVRIVEVDVPEIAELRRSCVESSPALGQGDRKLVEVDLGEKDSYKDLDDVLAPDLPVLCFNLGYAYYYNSEDYKAHLELIKDYFKNQDLVFITDGYVYTSQENGMPKKDVSFGTFDHDFSFVSIKDYATLDEPNSGLELLKSVFGNAWCFMPYFITQSQSYFDGHELLTECKELEQGKVSPRMMDNLRTRSYCGFPLIYIAHSPKA